MAWVRPTGMRRAWLVVVAVLAALLVLPSAEAWACSCARPSAARAVQAADVVLAGTPVAAHGQGQWGVEDAQRYALEVSTVYQGEAPARLVVHEDLESCGLGLLLGREHVVFLSRGPDGLVSSNCAGNDLAASGLVADVVALTGPGHGPTGAGPSGTDTGTAWRVPLFGGSALALLLGGALVLVLVRGRRRA